MSLSIKNGVLLNDKTPVRQIPSRNSSGAFDQPPTIVVMHYTAGGSALSSANWFSSRDNTNSSAHLVIERDGSILQCVGLDKVAWHAGKSTWRNLVGLNKYSIGIELANWGVLHGGAGGWLNAAGQAVPTPFVGVHRNGNPDGSRTPIGWEAFPAAQIEAAAAVCSAIAAAFPIAEIVGHDDIAPLRKYDPGPAFDMGAFRSRVLGGRSDNGAHTATVNAPGGLNLRSGPGLDYAAIALLPDQTKLEPIGSNNGWIEASVLGADGVATKTGWVHGRYVTMD